jgi:phosphoribosylformylglycinamidine synthase
MVPPHAFWFGEDQARYVITVPQEKSEAVIMKARATGVSVRRLGQTAGDTVNLPGERPMLVKVLAEAFEGWLPAYMAGQSQG